MTPSVGSPEPAAVEALAAARRARRQRRAAADTAEGLVPAPPPDPRSWQDALLAAIAARTGGPARYARAPEVLDHVQGPWAFGFELEPAVPGRPGADAWRGPLTVRLGDRADLGREAAALTVAAVRGLGVPAVVAEIELGAAGGPGGVPLSALVTTRPTDAPLPEVIVGNLLESEHLLGGFADRHVELHERTAGTRPPGVPVIDPAVEVDHLPGPVAWLRAHQPPPAGADRAVLCHGGYEPRCVHSPGPGAWDEHGGPGRGLTITNWCGAVVAEPEYDVAFTLVAFWSAPFFAPSRSERTTAKMIRNTLANGYRQAYRRRRPLDAERLAFWQVFHARRGVARLDGAYDSTGSPFAVIDRGPLPALLRAQLARYADLITES